RLAGGPHDRVVAVGGDARSGRPGTCGTGAARPGGGIWLVPRTRGFGRHSRRRVRRRSDDPPCPSRNSRALPGRPPRGPIPTGARAGRGSGPLAGRPAAGLRRRAVLGSDPAPLCAAEQEAVLRRGPGTGDVPGRDVPGGEPDPVALDAPGHGHAQAGPKLGRHRVPCVPVSAPRLSPASEPGRPRETGNSNSRTERVRCHRSWRLAAASRGTEPARGGSQRPCALADGTDLPLLPGSRGPARLTGRLAPGHRSARPGEYDTAASSLRDLAPAAACQAGPERNAPLSSSKADRVAA